MRVVRGRLWYQVSVVVSGKGGECGGECGGEL